MDNQSEKLPWYKRGSLYQIYPRSFKDSNDDGIGDIQGIIEKLDYLAGNDDSLGISAIWISPIYNSPMKDFGYDISDYYSIHPMFGSMDDFEQLVLECHKRDIAIVMDYIPSHTSEENQWFNESKSSLTNEKSDWYIWVDPAEDGGPPNNWLSVFGGSAWEYVESRNQYYMHTFLKEQPDLNWRNPDVVVEMQNVLRFWIKKGVDGFRTDAFPHVFKDPDLKNEPINPDYDESMWEWHKLKHIYTMDLPELSKLYNYFWEVFAEFPEHELFMLTEDFFADVEQLKWHYSVSDNNDFAPLNLKFPSFKWEASIFKEFTDKYYEALDKTEWPNFSFGNHDNPRLIDRIGAQNIKTAAVMLMTLRGLPVMYYGDELGIGNVEIPADRVQDTFELRDPGKGVGRDPERTPMQWDNTKYAGFSNAEPWLPLSTDYPTRNVAEMDKEPNSILKLYKSLVKIRSETPALQIGTYEPYETQNDDIFSYWRRHDNVSYLVVLNFSDESRDMSLPEGVFNNVISTSTSSDQSDKLSGSLELQSNSGIVLHRESDEGASTEGR